MHGSCLTWGHAWNPNTQEAKAEGSLEFKTSSLDYVWVQGQAGYIARSCLKKQTTTENIVLDNEYSSICFALYILFQYVKLGNEANKYQWKKYSNGVLKLYSQINFENSTFPFFIFVTVSLPYLGKGLKIYPTILGIWDF